MLRGMSHPCGNFAVPAPPPHTLCRAQIGVQAGVYDAALIVGDTRSAEPLLWGLGEANVLHPPLDDGSQPAAAPYRCTGAGTGTGLL
jgi:hypothetical protein